MYLWINVHMYWKWCGLGVPSKIRPKSAQNPSIFDDFRTDFASVTADFARDCGKMPLSCRGTSGGNFLQLSAIKFKKSGKFEKMGGPEGPISIFGRISRPWRPILLAIAAKCFFRVEEHLAQISAIFGEKIPTIRKIRKMGGPEMAALLRQNFAIFSAMYST